MSKEAYFLFRDADAYVNGYRDSHDKMAEARYYATLKVLVEQIPVPRRYSLSGDFFQQKNVLIQINIAKHNSELVL